MLLRKMGTISTAATWMEQTDRLIRSGKYSWFYQIVSSGLIAAFNSPTVQQPAFSLVYPVIIQNAIAMSGYIADCPPFLRVAGRCPERYHDAQMSCRVVLSVEFFNFDIDVQCWGHFNLGTNHKFIQIQITALHCKLMHCNS